MTHWELHVIQPSPAAIDDLDESGIPFTLHVDRADLTAALMSASDAIHGAPVNNIVVAYGEGTFGRAVTAQDVRIETRSDDLGEYAVPSIALMHDPQSNEPAAAMVWQAASMLKVAAVFDTNNPASLVRLLDTLEGRTPFPARRAKALTAGTVIDQQDG